MQQCTNTMKYRMGCECVFDFGLAKIFVKRRRRSRQTINGKDQTKLKNQWHIYDGMKMKQAKRTSNCSTLYS